MQQYSFREHFIELKNRLAKVVVFFIIAFGVSYWFKEDIYNILLQPLADLTAGSERKIIYTGLTEAFTAYIKLSMFFAFVSTVPVICYQLCVFIIPGLLQSEKKIVIGTLALSPILFYLGSLFVYSFVMPRAWLFFLSYENNSISLPLVMEARISEYLSLVMQLMIAFGIAFQLPFVMIVLSVIGIINADTLRQRRRIAIVIIFIVAAIFTPPDVISQIALAIPLLLLYEVSIVLCKLVEKKES